MIALLAALLTVAPPAIDVPLVDGGFCTGLAWVPVDSGMTVTRNDGPDFAVFYVGGSSDKGFGVYVGGYPRVEPDPGKPLIETDGVAVRPTHIDGKFTGYIVGNADYLRNHFFGPRFSGDANDAGFFRRAAFGTDGRARCSTPVPPAPPSNPAETKK